MELQGEVIEIIFKNELNSYCIAIFKVDKDFLKKDALSDEIDVKGNISISPIDIDGETTIVGYLPFVSIGDTLKVVGKFVDHPEYGKQFKVDTLKN